MNPKPKVNGLRKAASMLLALAALVVFTPGAVANAGGACTETDDDGGFGGSDVSCTLGCGAYAELAIAASASDPDATVSGGYNCGGASAGCLDAGQSKCAGISPGLTSTSESGKDACTAESDEIWSSAVMVACANTVGVPGDGGPSPDPMEIICRTYPNFPGCHGLQSLVQDVKDALGEPEILRVAQVCKDEAEAQGYTFSDEELAGLFPAAFAGLELASMVAFAHYPDGSMVQVLVTSTEERTPGMPSLPAPPSREFVCQVIPGDLLHP